jgi:hypothetical protein
MPNVDQKYFYKAPVPLLIGNLPFGDDFKNKRHEYEYLDYYIIPNQTSNLHGILYYNKFFKNYTIICGESTNSNSVPLNWSYMYPHFYIDGNVWSLNPFVNSPNGSCVWIKEESKYSPFSDSNYETNTNDTSSAGSIYYNFTSNQYEWGLGEDVHQYEGVTYQVNNANKCNGYSFNGIDPVADSNPYLQTLDEVVNMKCYDLNISNLYVGFTNKLQPEFEGNESQFNFKDLTDPENFNKTFMVSTVNDSNIVTDTHYHGKINGCKLIRGKDLAYSYNYIYDRLNFLKDLDHEDEPEKYEEICGVYENNSEEAKSAFVLGSIVIGNENHRDDIGWFIGINSLVSDYRDITGSGGGSFTSSRRIQASNIIPIPLKRVSDIGIDYKYKNENYINYYNCNFLYVLGYAWKSNKKKYLVCLDYRSEFQDFFIVDDSPEKLFSQQTQGIWKSFAYTVFSTQRHPKLFQYPFQVDSWKFKELTFKYSKLKDYEWHDDESKEPITFKIIGACRENAYENILGLNISKTDLENQFSNGQTAYTQSNTYIGYWDTPIINFKEN